MDHRSATSRNLHSAAQRPRPLVRAGPPKPRPSTACYVTDGPAISPAHSSPLAVDLVTAEPGHRIGDVIDPGVVKRDHHHRPGRGVDPVIQRYDFLAVPVVDFGRSGCRGSSRSTT